MRSRADREQTVVAAPPLIYFLGLVVGVALDAFIPITLPEAFQGSFGATAPLGNRLAIGPPLFTTGFALNLWAVRTFRRADTTVLPWGKPSSLVPHGPYRITRNPMYLGLSIAYAGLALTIGSVWAILVLPAVLAVMVYGVIRREEAYLAWRFGEDYDAYKARVRRWF